MKRTIALIFLLLPGCALLPKTSTQQGEFSAPDAANVHETSKQNNGGIAGSRADVTMNFNSGWTTLGVTAFFFVFAIFLTVHAHRHIRKNHR